MFADDTNLFLSHRNLKTLFQTANRELEYMNGLKQINFHLQFPLDKWNPQGTEENSFT